MKINSIKLIPFNERKVPIRTRPYIALLFIFVNILFINQLAAQEKQRNWELGGYVKNLQTINNVKLRLDTVNTNFVFQDNLVHNRLNFSWYINDYFKFKTGIRNRIFYGPRSVFLGEFDGDGGNDFFDLSVNWIDQPNFIFNSTIDRLYIEYSKDDWEVRLGRQRINWGINTFWNPHDVFNVFNFTDFDYEERPGSDAIRVKYYTGATSSLELAVGITDTLSDFVAGLLWKFNKWNYDFQLIGAWANEDVVAGIGWAGNLGNASFKGEASTFIPTKNEGEAVSFAGTLGVEYSFKKGLFVGGGFLFNSNGSSDAAILELFSFELSAKTLYPYEWAIYTQAGYPITPLISTNFAVIYSPSKTHGLFLNPSFTYSLSNDWDLGLFGQFSFVKEDKFYSPIQSYFLRIKYSF